MQRRERIGDVRIAFDDQGAGATVLLLHPFPFDGRIWADNVPLLINAGYRVITVDFPGFGDSPAPRSELSIEELGDLAAELIERLKIERAALIGLSMGGYVALAFAHRFRRRLWALVLADTRADSDGPEARQGRTTALAAIREKGVDAYLRQSLPRLLGPHASPQLQERVYLLAEKREHTLTSAIAALRDRPDRRNELAQIACPTLVLVGTEDQVSRPGEMSEMATAIPGARFTQIARAGHLSNIEAPADFNQAVIDFLRAASPATQGASTR